MNWDVGGIRAGFVSLSRYAGEGACDFTGQRMMERDLIKAPTLPSPEYRERESVSSVRWPWTHISSEGVVHLGI